MQSGFSRPLECRVFGFGSSSSNEPFTMNAIFPQPAQGVLYEPYDIANLYQDAAGTVAVTAAGDPIGLVKDKSGNNINAVQTVSTKRPTYGVTPSRLVIDKVDDELVIVVPTGGWIGTMVLATINGTASYEMDIPAGNFVIGGQYYPTTNIVGVLLLNKSLSASDKAKAEEYFVSKGATASYIGMTDFSSRWRYFDKMTHFPLIDTSNAVTLALAFNRCSKLVYMPQINTAKVKDFSNALAYCPSLVTMPLLNTSSGDNFGGMFYACSSLTTVPSNMFDNVKSGSFSNTFTQTNLSQASIDGVLTSLVTSGIATGTRVFDQSGGSAPSATGRAAIDTLRSRGWTVITTGGY